MTTHDNFIDRLHYSHKTVKRNRLYYIAMEYQLFLNIYISYIQMEQ